MTLLAAEAVQRFGNAPKVALLSHSNFGASNSPSARKMRKALALIRAADPDLEIDGEMHADSALVESIRSQAVPDSRLSGSANLLVMPNIDSANIAYNLVKATGEGGDRRPVAARAGQAAPHCGAERHGPRAGEHQRGRGNGGGAAGEKLGPKLTKVVIARPRHANACIRVTRPWQSTFPCGVRKRWIASLRSQ